MEREPLDVTHRLLRAARSLAYNRELQPLVRERIARAEGQIRGYMLARGLAETHVGGYELALDEEGDIEVSRRAVADWQQMTLEMDDDGRNTGEDFKNGGDWSVNGGINSRIVYQYDADSEPSVK